MHEWSEEIPTIRATLSTLAENQSIPFVYFKNNIQFTLK